MFGPLHGIRKSIKTYFRYFANSLASDAWGFHLSAVGHARVPSGADYPPARHPAGRQFQWSRGRVLPTLQVLVLRSGRGEIEWTNERRELKAGQGALLRPGEWHRYRPDPETGWTEDWLELSGPSVEAWVGAGLFPRHHLKIHDRSEFFSQFDRLHEAAQSATETAIGTLAATAMLMLTQLAADAPVQAAVSSLRPRQREMMLRARKLMEQRLPVAQIADQLGVSYPTLHRVFRSAAGITPKRYGAMIRLARAEALLCSGTLGVKEIAAQLGFASASHFSSAFKAAYGASPAHWKERLFQEGASPSSVVDA